MQFYFASPFFPRFKVMQSPRPVCQVVLYCNYTWLSHHRWPTGKAFICSRCRTQRTGLQTGKSLANNKAIWQLKHQYSVSPPLCVFHQNKTQIELHSDVSQTAVWPIPVSHSCRPVVWTSGHLCSVCIGFSHVIEGGLCGKDPPDF